MSKTSVSNTQAKNFAPQALYPFSFFSLGGLDMYSPDEVASPNRCVYGRNFRVFNPGSFLQRSAIAKRMGHSFYSVPVGETVDQQITSTTGAADQSIGLITWLAQKYTAGATGNLTKLDIRLKNTTSGTGPVMVALYSDNSGTPGTLLATSSVVSSTITNSYNYLSPRFIEAPTQTNGTSYWVVAYIQSDGSNTYSWSSTTSASTAKVSVDGGNTWSSTSYALNLKTYVSTSGEVKGLTRYYRSSGSPQSVFAQISNVYTVNDGTGAVTSIKGGLNASATTYDWANVNDNLYFVNGFDNPQVYNGSTVATAGGSPPVADNVEVYANRLFYLQPNTNLAVFSDAGSYETFQANSFLYIPSPKTADPCIKMVSFSGNMCFLTRNTKYTLFGNDLASFTVREATAKRGAVSATAVCTDQSFIYFMSGDFHIYAYNGGTDTKLSSERVASILQNVANTSSIRLEIHDKKLFVHYTPSGQTVNEHRLVWDLVFNEWMNDEYVYTGFGLEWNSQSDTGQWIQASTQVGALYYGDVGFNDVGKPISFDWWSKYLSFGVPAARHRVKRHYVFLQGEDGNYSVDCQVDEDNLNSPTSNFVGVDVSAHKYGDVGLVYGTTASGGSGLVYGDGVLYPVRLNVPGQYYKTQFRFVQSGVDQPVDILGWTDYVLFKKPR